MRGRRLEKKARGGGARNTTSLANFAEDGRIEVGEGRFRAIKTLYTMNVYDSNAETEGRK